MGQPFADWAERIMLGMSEFIVPVKQLWNLHCEQNDIPRITPEQLADVLREDDRFYFIEEPEKEWQESEDEAARLEKMGFYMGPKVMLQGRIPTKKQLIDAITQNLDKMMLNLRKAYEIRPKDSDQTEDELIDVMLKADQLKKEILKAMSDDIERAERVNNGSPEDQAKSGHTPPAAQ